MQYRKNNKNNDELSLLGLGCMRFPDKGLSVDEEVGVAMIIKAIELGVNYFDSAYVYHRGNSEGILGKALSQGYRDKVKIATKLPHYLVRKASDIDRIFTTQLKRLQTDYIDYYMPHMLSDVKIWQKLVDFGFDKWLEEKKEKGIIKNFGFSFHGRYEDFVQLIDLYDWDFCQIQYNYLDINYQAGTAGLKYVHAKKIPVIVMEPLRGGQLVNNLPKEVLTLLHESNMTPAEFGMSWLFDQPEITLVLSGMSNEAQLIENVNLTDKYGINSLSDKQHELIEKARDIITKNIKVPCTQCRYCMPCPSGVEIPGCFISYNEKYSYRTKNPTIVYVQNTNSFGSKPGNAAKCTNCGICVAKCPQSIDIPKELNVIRKEMETPVFKFISSVGKIVLGTRNKG